MKFGISGMAVVYGGADLSNEYFDSSTDFGMALDRQPLYYDHGGDSTIARQRIGSGSLIREASGLRFDGEVDVPAKFANSLKRLISSGLLGYSTGALSHLVERQLQPDGRTKIVTWVVGETSLTTSPCEPRTGTNFKKTLEEIKAANSARLAQIQLEQRRRVAYLNHLRVKHIILCHNLGIATEVVIR